jgi:small subunit ribosomal protein S21
LAQVKVDKNMPIEKALRKFKSMCNREGIIDEVRKRRAYEKPSLKKRRTSRKGSSNSQKRPITGRAKPRNNR